MQKTAGRQHHERPENPVNSTGMQQVGAREEADRLQRNLPGDEDAEVTVRLIPIRQHGQRQR